MPKQIRDLDENLTPIDELLADGDDMDRWEIEREAYENEFPQHAGPNDSKHHPRFGAR